MSWSTIAPYPSPSQGGPTSPSLAAIPASRRARRRAGSFHAQVKWPRDQGAVSPGNRAIRLCRRLGTLEPSQPGLM